MKTASQKTAITVLTRLSKRSSRNWGMVKIFFSKKIGMKNFATRIGHADKLFGGDIGSDDRSAYRPPGKPAPGEEIIAGIPLVPLPAA